MKNMEQLEVEISELKEVRASINNRNKGKAGFQIFYTKTPLFYGSQKIVGFGLEYERLIISDILGIRFNANYVLSPDKEPEINPRSSANSTSSPEYHSHKGIDVNVSVPIHIKGASIAPKFGHTILKYKSTTKSYNNFGVAQDAQVERHHFDDNYIGIGLRYENRFFIEVEPRKYIRSREEVLKVGVRISIDF